MRRPTGAPSDGQASDDQPVLGATHLGGEGLQPHRVCTFKISNDPTFADKLKDVVGLYVDPPAHAVVPALTRKAKSRPLIAHSPAADDEAALRP
jgi:hypothetical protein